MRSGTAGRERALEGNHLDRDRAVVVGEPRQAAANRDGAAELLPDFAHERVLRRFARFHLAAGKLPFEPKVLVRGTLGEEDTALLVANNRTDNRDGTDRIQPGRAGRSVRFVATFPQRRGSGGMKAFLKIVLLVIAAVIAVKLLPLTLAAGCVLGLVLVGVAVVGVSVIAVVLGALLLIALVSSPIWLPILALAGLIALFKRDNGGAARA